MIKILLYQILPSLLYMEKNMSQEFRLEKVDEASNYFVEEIDQIEFVSKKHKKVCTTLNYIKYFLILANYKV